MKTPLIKTSLPGPKASEFIRADAEFVSPSYTRVYPLVVERAQGLWVQDVDGNQFLDFTAGIAVNSTGHCHPEVVEAIRDQAGKLIHMSGTDFYYSPQIILAAKAGRNCEYDRRGQGSFTATPAQRPWKPHSNSSRYHTRREQTISFFGCVSWQDDGGAFSYRKQSLSEKVLPPVRTRYYSRALPELLPLPLRRLLSHLRFGVRAVDRGSPFPHQHSARRKLRPYSSNRFRERADISCPPPEFHVELSRLAKKYGILLVADEIQSGMGRTGKMFAMEHFGVEPDIMALAKGIASGMPLGAMIANAKLMDWHAGSHASTFGGNPVSCRAALVTIDLLQKGLIENAEIRGRQLMAGLSEMQKSFECMGDVRGKGLMVGVELVKDRITKESAPDLRDLIVQSAFHSGLLLLGCGESTDSFLPRSYHQRGGNGHRAFHFRGNSEKARRLGVSNERPARKARYRRTEPGRSHWTGSPGLPGKDPGIHIAHRWENPRQNQAGRLRRL